MIQRDILSWIFRPRFLQPWGKPASHLFAGPWMGEFGWELMNWQPFLRWLSKRYQKITVACREENRALYSDFATDFIFHKIKGTGECNKFLEVENPGELQRVLAAVPPDSDHLPTVGWQPVSRKTFIRFGSPKKEFQSDVLFHARGRSFGTDRNWSLQHWETLVSSLLQKGYSVGSIGLKSATLDLSTQHRDFRNLPLSETMSALNSTRLLLGPSSGPMHLASLCGTAHLVWTDTSRYARGRTNRQKYEQWWNPLGTRAVVIDEFGFNPSPETIEKVVLNILEGNKGEPV